MIAPAEFVDALERLDVRLATGVPDSLLKEACAALTARLPPERHVIAANEGSAIGLAIGHYLATGRPALVYMQNAGLGNAVNPLASLADPQVYGVPMVLMIGWRGEILPDGRQLRDEPQHVKQGQITLAQLDVLGIPHRVADAQTAAVEPLLRELVELALARSQPTALVVRKNAFAPHGRGEPAADDGLAREAAIQAVAAALPADVPVVATTGMASRELFEWRAAKGAGHARDFLTVGGMGHAVQIAAGIAMARPGRRVVCLDGDGAALMHLGGWTTAADCANLLHVVLNNGAHDSVGGQPTKGRVLDFARTCRAVTLEEIAGALRTLLAGAGSALLEIKCRRGARPNLGRPTQTPAQTKLDFMRFLQEDGP